MAKAKSGQNKTQFKNLNIALVIMNRPYASLRREGFNYILLELKFLKHILKYTGYYYLIVIIIFAIRLIIRILPFKYITENLSWRTNWKYIDKKDFDKLYAK